MLEERLKDSFSLFLLSTLLLIKFHNCNCWHPTEQMSSVEEHWCQKRGELSPSISTRQSERAKEVDQSHRLRRKHSCTLSADSCYLCVRLLCRSHIISTLPACRLSFAYFRVNGTSLKHNVPGNIQKVHLRNISYRSLITHIGCQMVYNTSFPGVRFLSSLSHRICMIYYCCKYEEWCQLRYHRNLLLLHTLRWFFN